MISRRVHEGGWTNVVSQLSALMKDGHGYHQTKGRKTYRPLDLLECLFPPQCQNRVADTESVESADGHRRVPCHRVGCSAESSAQREGQSEVRNL